MAFTLKKFEVLKSDFSKNIQSLLKKHNVTDVKNLPHERRDQVQFLEAAIAELEKSSLKGNQKPKILSGLMYVVSELINDSYSYRSEKNSTLFRLLIENLGVTDENQLTQEDKFSLISVAISFVSQQIFVESRTENGMREDHIFSDINGYGVNTPNKTNSLGNFWHICNNMLAQAKNEIFARTEKELIDDVRERKTLENAKNDSHHGLLSVFFSKAATKPESDDTEPKPGLSTPN